MNLNVLRMTIQGLEMQKAGLAAMQGAGKEAGGGETPPRSDAPRAPRSSHPPRRSNAQAIRIHQQRRSGKH